MKRIILILLSIFLPIIIGVFIGVSIYNDTESDRYSVAFDNNQIIKENDIDILTIETSKQEEKTTPNTLIIYKTYYTKCKHYTQEYRDIDLSLVNLTEQELKKKCKDWNINKFSAEEIEMNHELEEFCGQHYKIKLNNNAIVIYSVDESGLETEYEHTGITTEYLTKEDILKLTSGIYVYGKENLTSILEDYE